jgi:N-acetylglucosaminyldiphosphoundecaprenol N-acetyl-beta-D-mannosaminyltransferase
MSASLRTVVPGPGRVSVAGVAFDPVTEADVVTHVRAALRAGVGGRISTPNVDILRLIADDPALRAHVTTADLVVADGMPVVWASRLRHGRAGLPERVAGSDLIWSLCAACAIDRRRVFLIGGVPPAGEEEEVPEAGRGAGQALAATIGVGVAPAGHAGRPAPDPDAGRDWTGTRELPAGGLRAAAVLGTRYPGLVVAGAVSPPFGFLDDPAQCEGLRDTVVAARPDLVLVGLGFAKQERVIDLLAGDLPRAWFLGCGAAIDFVDGDQRRAPEWMRRSGLEWVHRLSREPGRLAGRYLRHDLPYALTMLTRAATRR